MIADDIKTSINVSHTIPDGTYTDKKGTVTNYKENKCSSEDRMIRMMSLVAAISTALCQESYSGM